MFHQYGCPPPLLGRARVRAVHVDTAAAGAATGPNASLTELFVGLHGTPFTIIQLDDFKRMLERFREKLQIGGK